MRLFRCALLLVALLPATARARTFVLNADGSGDVVTFQAGLDSIAARSEEYGDSLIVGPGSYDEDARLSECVRGVVITAPSGPAATHLRSLHLSTGQSSCGSNAELMSVSGLAIGDTLSVDRIPAAFADCWFMGPVHFDVRGRSQYRSFRRCLFKQSFYFDHQSGLDSCRFEGPTTFHANDSGVGVSNSTFANTDTAATVRGSPYRFSFAGCTFRNVRFGVVVTDGQLSVKACRFEDVAEAAISRGYDEHTPTTLVDACAFERCGTAIRIHTDFYAFVTMTADTVTNMGGPGITVTAGRINGRIDGVRVSGCQGDGIALDGGEGDEGYALGISNCLIEANTGAGFRLSHTPSLEIAGSVIRRNGENGIEWEAGALPGRLANNTVAENGLWGIKLRTPLDIESPDATIEDNLVVGNGAGGVSIGAANGYVGAVRHNDAWMNRGPAYEGLAPGEPNLESDPQFCDVVLGDFRVAFSSPCAPSGPYGQIGALGAGCDVMTVPVDVQSRFINPRSNAPVEAAILGHPLFDPRRVDPSTVRLAGAAPASRGNGRTVTQVKDVNQDGIADLLLSFNSRDLRLDGGEATLEGRTFDGVPFRGSDAVEVARTPLRASLESAADVPTRLALAVPLTHGVLSLLLDLPNREPATIEIFDVTGRRVVSRDLSALGAGRHRLQLQERLASGLYLLRLSQGTDAVVARGVVLR